MQAATQVTPPNCFCITPTLTGISSTLRPSHPPLDFNLSSICGYTFDNYELWRVYNNTDSDATYVWRVKGTDETGSGKVAAHGNDYFTTSEGLKTVTLYVGDQLVDTEACLAPCKKELLLSYTCTDSGLAWLATNPNSFSVGYTLKVDGEEAGKGVMTGNNNVTVVTTTSGEHTVELTWTDTRPGFHSVSLSSPPNSCAGSVITTETPTLPVETVTVTPTVSPTVTETPASNMIPTATVTLTSTFTQTGIPSETVTPTTTLTPQPSATPTVTSTLTPTPTSTITLTSTVTPTPTPTLTSTSTATPTATSTSTSTPTTTLTPQGGVIPTVTATSIVTLAPPVSTVTSTPVLIPVTGVDLTRPIGANSLALFGGLFTNIGLFTLGLALALTGITSQMKD
jgi:hypothetical protein